VQRTLDSILADPHIAVAPIGPSSPSPLAPDIFKPIEPAARAVWNRAPATPASLHYLDYLGFNAYDT